MLTPFSFKELEFNIAFGLWSTDFVTRPSSNIEDYLGWNAYLLVHSVVGIENGADYIHNENFIPLKHHKCTSDEAGFFDANDSIAAWSDHVMPLFECLDGAQDIELWGGFD